MISSQQVRDIFAEFEAIKERLAKLEAAVHPVVDPQFAEMEEEQPEAEAKGGKKQRRAA